LPSRRKRVKKRRLIALQAPRGAVTQKLAHDESRVERCRVHEQAFENIRVPSQIHAPQATGFVQVREAPFQHLAPLP